MKIYNSLSGKVEKFETIIDGQVSMYVCGPTVYDHPHIGNARPLIVFDLVYRFLTALGYQVNYVSNYTDIDDKIINKAIFKNKSANLISEYYIKAYEALGESLNIKKPKTIKVTETIDQIIQYIEKMITAGYAYEIDGDVYFRVSKVNDYGVLSKQKIEDLVVGARIDENIKKENPLDFTLWKQTDVGESYTSKWSKGRPGWHTECVVMIKDSFDTDIIDIHGGGLDLKFPHHENEIAQANACGNTHLANYWMHNGLIEIDNKKMSKSQGTLVLAKDMVADLGSDVVRWMLLSTHYRAPLKLSDLLIKQSQIELARVINGINQAFTTVILNKIQWNAKFSCEDLELFYRELMDDFNTANAYKVIFDSIKKLNSLLRVKEIDFLETIKLSNAIIMMLDILGIEYKPMAITLADIKLYENWNLAKAAKDFDIADIYRKQLSERGLI